MNQPVLRFFRGFFEFFMALGFIALVASLLFVMIDVFVIDIPFLTLDLLRRTFFGGLIGFFVFGGISVVFDNEIYSDYTPDRGFMLE